jgi:hypothetical protein
MSQPYTRTASNDLLQGLVDLGIEYLFCNLGTDHAPLIEEMAHWREQGRAFPNLILCPHENTAWPVVMPLLRVVDKPYWFTSMRVRPMQPWACTIFVAHEFLCCLLQVVLL